MEVTMRNRSILALAATLCAAGALAADVSPEAKFAKLIEGKVAGKPVDCIDTRRGSASLSAYGDKLVYTIDRKLLYVSDTNGGCTGVARGDALVTRQFQTQLCRGDIARTVNLPAGIDTGSCALGSFTPYRGR
jgi:hypothetical protein